MTVQETCCSKILALIWNQYQIEQFVSEDPQKQGQLISYSERKKEYQAVYNGKLIPVHVAKLTKNPKELLTKAPSISTHATRTLAGALEEYDFIQVALHANLPQGYKVIDPLELSSGFKSNWSSNRDSHEGDLVLVCSATGTHWLIYFDLKFAMKEPEGFYPNEYNPRQFKSAPHGNPEWRKKYMTGGPSLTSVQNFGNLTEEHYLAEAYPRNRTYAGYTKFYYYLLVSLDLTYGFIISGDNTRKGLEFLVDRYGPYQWKELLPQYLFPVLIEDIDYIRVF